MLKTGETWSGEFTVQNPTTGALVNADSLPTGTLVLNTVNDGATVTVANKTTGRYTFSVTMPTLDDNDNVDIFIAATVGGTAGGGIVAREMGTTKRVAELTEVTETQLAAAVWDALLTGITQAGSIGDLLITNVDVLISSRSTPANVDAAVLELKALIDSGTAAAFTADTITLEANVPVDGAIPRGAQIIIKSATTGSGQVGIVRSYASGVATMTADWAPALTGTVTYEVLAAVRPALDMVDSSDNRRIDQILREMRAVISGRVDLNGTRFKTPDGTVNRVVATLDASQNRTAMDVTGAD